MLITDENKAIYVAIVKNGSRYVTEVLNRYYNFRTILTNYYEHHYNPNTVNVEIRHPYDNPHPNQDNFHRNDFQRLRDQDKYHHSITKGGKYRYYETHPYVKAERLEQYFTFSFVRNPYERLVSAFAYLKRTLYKNPDTAIHKTPENKQYYIDFPTFIRHREDVVPVAYYHAFITQYDQLLNSKGEMKISFIGKVETLDDDLVECLTILGFPILHQKELFFDKRINVNQWEDKDITNYFDKESFEFANEHFKCDFEYFGYKRYESWEDFMLNYKNDNSKVKSETKAETESTPVVQLYKEVETMKFGYNKHIEITNKYKEFVNSLINELEKTCFFNKSNTLDNFEKNMKYLEDKHDDITNSLKNKLKEMSLSLKTNVYEHHESSQMKCKMCGFQSHNILSSFCHYKLCDGSSKDDIKTIAYFT
jgi:hypothetical protein